MKLNSFRSPPKHFNTQITFFVVIIFANQLLYFKFGFHKLIVIGPRSRSDARFFALIN